MKNASTCTGEPDLGAADARGDGLQPPGQAVGVIERRVGRLLRRQQRAAKFYDIRVSDTPSGAKHDWTKRDELWTQAGPSDGCYVLRSNVTDWSAEELWQAYTQLTEAEAAYAHTVVDPRYGEIAILPFLKKTSFGCQVSSGVP